MFYIKKSFFGTAYGIATPFLVWIYTFIFLDKYAHGGYSSYEVAFRKIPDIIKFRHYILWDPVYYYDSEDNYPKNKKQLIYGSDSNSITLS